MGREGMKRNSGGSTSGSMSAPSSDRFIENYTLPVRRVSRPSGFYLSRAQRWWRAATVSLPLDALVVMFLPASFPPGPAMESLFRLQMVCLAAAALGLFRENIFELLERIWLGRTTIAEYRKRYGPYVIAAFVALSLVELYIQLGSFGWIVVVIIIAASLRSIGEIRRTLAASRERDSAFKRDRLLLLEERNLQVFLLAAAPILGARLFGLTGAVLAAAEALPERRFEGYLTAALPALVLLLSLYPHREHFIARCPRCARAGSRVLASLGGCPACAREEFQIKDEPAQPMSADLTLESSPETGDASPPADEAPADEAAPPTPVWRSLLTRLRKSSTAPTGKDC